MTDNKKLLITGGTGSFGNAVLQGFLDSKIAEIRIFSRDEKKQDDMRKKYNNPKEDKERDMLAVWDLCLVACAAELKKNSYFS